MPRLIKKSILINASPHTVWRVFTDPSLTKKLGGHYVSNWKVGESLEWKAEDGKMYTYGIILSIEPDSALKHSLYDIKTKSKITSIISYRFEANDNSTLLHAEEELAYEVREDQFEEALEGWDMALESIKELAESESRVSK